MIFSSSIAISYLLVLLISWNGVVSLFSFGFVQAPLFYYRAHHQFFNDEHSPEVVAVEIPSESHSIGLTMVLGSGGLSPEEDSRKIRYLGAGDDAIIRPGVVLVAPVHEYDHFLMRSAVFIHAIGIDDEHDNVIIRGVVIDHPTAFTIGEMSPNVMGKLSDNRLFRGGYDGNDTAMMLHSAGGPDGPVQSNTMIGSSGIFEGGIVSAMESCDAGVIEPDQCKFFFNYMQFTQKELDNMFGGVEDGDAWVSLEIPADYVLNSDYERGQLWSKLRNFIRDTRKHEDPS